MQAAPTYVCEAPDCENPRRENGQGGRSRYCSSHDWHRKKANPKRHAHAKARNQVATEKYRKADPERRRKVLLKDALKKPPGPASPRAPRSVYAVLTPKEWQAVWRSVNGQCPMCQCALRNRYDPASEGRVAVVDHIHRVEKDLVASGVERDEALRRSIRGMLCGWCNHRVLTMLRDDAGYAQRTADYLRDSFTAAQAIIHGETPRRD